MDEAQLREHFCRALNQLWMRGMIVGCDGLLSCEVHRRRYLVTPMGIRRVDLKPDDLICVDIGGENVQGGEGIPPETWQPHRDAYQTHLDPTGSGLRASAFIEPAHVLALLGRYDGQPQMDLCCGPVPILDGADAGKVRETLAENTEAVIRYPNHSGLFVAATDLPKLLNRIERLDLSAAIQLAGQGQLTTP
ncbi:MAG: hypothetical protein Kow00105_10930 [Phycisphaeraceae bacterium]